MTLYCGKDVFLEVLLELSDLTLEIAPGVSRALAAIAPVTAAVFAATFGSTSTASAVVVLLSGQ